MNRRRAVITGVGAVTSFGVEKEDLWNALVAGKSGIKEITGFDASGFKVRIASEVTDFRPEEYLDKKLARHLDRFAQFALVAAMKAVEDSGIDFSRIDPFRAGVIIGSGIGGLIEIEKQHTRLLTLGASRISPFMIPKLMVNAASGQISIMYGLKGPNTAVATACASGSHAIGDAFKIIQSGDADVIISGGSEAAITPMGVGGFAAMRALSCRNDAPEKASRPFDLERDGFVLGEGAGVVVLEEMEMAKKRGAHIYAEMLGFGMSGDGWHITAPDPEGAGPSSAMRVALNDARISPQDVKYINAHGTSTPLNDEVETKAIKKVFGPSANGLAVSSTKSMLGHLLGASGGVEMVITALAVEQGVMPPTTNYENPDPKCDLDYVPNTAREERITVAMSNSFGFGGHNASLIIGQLDH
ncbi:MAG: 3-oxoacyl-ACP synthase [Planctomycetes bacterium DG_23]|nr:MAG: 3-oxoacyl-ACP synthase [Planctomycetes bacterium DG_23]